MSHYLLISRLPLFTRKMIRVNANGISIKVKDTLFVIIVHLRDIASAFGGL